MTTQPSDPQVYKEIVVRDIKAILSELNKDLPWLAADIAISVQDRMGKNNPFAQKILGDVLAGLSEEDLVDTSAECAPESDVRIRQMATGITGAQMDSERVHAILAKPAFSLDTELADGCTPCDGGESGPIAMGILGGSAKKQFAKIKIAQHIVADINKLTAHKQTMLTNAEEFKDESIGVNTILEAIDARCQR